MIFTFRNIFIALIFLVLVVVVMIAWRMFFQFNNKEVKAYIKEEADKFGSMSDQVYAILRDGVEAILQNRNLTQQVIRSAQASGTPKEQELVHAAYMQAVSYGYLIP